MDQPTTFLTVLERLAALQRQIPGVKVALPGYLILPAQFPAFTNRVASMTPAYLTGMVRETWTVAMRLLVGTLETGYAGQIEESLYALMRAVPAHFAARPRLDLDGQPLVGLGGPAVVGACTGIQPFNDGLYAHIGAEFLLTIPLIARF